jgi:transcription elongation factor Elf1
MKDWTCGYVDSYEVKEKLRAFLKQNNIYAEFSGCGSGYHVEVLSTADEVEMINEFLDSVYER